MQFKQTTDMLGDSTCWYEVIVDEGTTVEQFINDVLTRDEWGSIGIYDKAHFLGNPMCEYKGSTLTTKKLPDKYLKSKISKIEANGGWSLMNYIIHIEEETMSISKVIENSYQWGEKKLTRAELERLESQYWKQATNFASEGMYASADTCKTKAQLVHDLLIGYKWEEE